ncbi:MAG: hypothetical protein CMM48_03985 [Rhodospirillaceae bacterium]|nr:hypothetical protein [Rhodospirillaceae bacterium]HAA91045.1 hypothetical protein [Rhodospirillaceae bacterium]
MTYGKDEFIADCRSAMRTLPGDEARESIRVSMEKLLENKEFIAENLGPDREEGRHTVYRDEETGFNLLFHIFDHANGAPPHDHGSSWAVYGQAVGHTDMTEWDYDESGEELEVSKAYRLEPGQAGIFAPGAIHSIEYTAGARFVRVTGVDLETVTRRVFDKDTHEMSTQNSNGAGFTAEQ